MADTELLLSFLMAAADTANFKFPFLPSRVSCLFNGLHHNFVNSWQSVMTQRTEHLRD
jgi:hypothetical protein